jgi:hypothetical protein
MTDYFGWTDILKQGGITRLSTVFWLVSFKDADVSQT